MDNEGEKWYLLHISRLKLTIFLAKIALFARSAQNASKCIQNELSKCFVHEIIKEVVFITFKVAKIDELLLSLRCRIGAAF